ncbi:MAG: hypothetical protein V4534_03595 [Myxococcota bacterium]
MKLISKLIAVMMMVASMSFAHDEQSAPEPQCTYCQSIGNAMVAAFGAASYTYASAKCATLQSFNAAAVDKIDGLVFAAYTKVMPLLSGLVAAASAKWKGASKTE